MFSKVLERLSEDGFIDENTSISKEIDDRERKGEVRNRGCIFRNRSSFIKHKHKYRV